MSNTLNTSMNNGNGATSSNNGGAISGGRTKSRGYAPGITAGAEDAKYASKFKDLRRKVKEIEADNDKILFKLLQAKRSIQRAKLERAILYERLAAIPASPPQNRQTLPLPTLPPPQAQPHELVAPGSQHISIIHTHNQAPLEPALNVSDHAHSQGHDHSRQLRHSRSSQQLQHSPPEQNMTLIDAFPTSNNQVLLDADGRVIPRDWRFVQDQPSQEILVSGEPIRPHGELTHVSPHSERHHNRSHGHSSRRHHSLARDIIQQQQIEAQYLPSEMSPHLRSQSRSSQPQNLTTGAPLPYEPHQREYIREWDQGRHSSSMNRSSHLDSPPPLGLEIGSNVSSRRPDIHDLAGIRHAQISPGLQQRQLRSPSNSRHRSTSISSRSQHHLPPNNSGRTVDRERGRDTSSHSRIPTPPFAYSTERPYEDYNMDVAENSPPPLAGTSRRTSFSSHQSHHTRPSGLADYDRDRRRGAGARLSDLVNMEPATIHHSGNHLAARRVQVVGSEENDLRMELDSMEIGRNGVAVNGHSHHRAAPPEDRDRNRALNWPHHADRALTDEELERDRGVHRDPSADI